MFKYLKHIRGSVWSNVVRSVEAGLLTSVGKFVWLEKSVFHPISPTDVLSRCLPEYKTKNKQIVLLHSGDNGEKQRSCHEQHLGYLLPWHINRKLSVGQLIRTERAVSGFLWDLPTSPATTISIWFPLRPHLSWLHQVAFLQISPIASYTADTTC